MVTVSRGAGFAGANNIMIFIDGGYLRKHLKELFGHDDANYVSLVNYLRANGILDTRFAAHVIRVYYYDGIANIKDVDSISNAFDDDLKLKGLSMDIISDKENKQEKYVNQIKNLELFEVRLGRHVLSTSGGLANEGGKLVLETKGSR